jgi:hypothetical protein
MVSRFFLPIVLGLMALPATAAPVQFLDLPATFTPGTPFGFKLALPAMTNLGAYEISISLTGDGGIAGTDFYFDGMTSQLIGGAVTRGYVFSTLDNFFSTTNNSGNESIFTLSDFDLTGVDVTDGVNDLLGEISIMTLPGFRGRLRLAVDADSLIFDTPDFTSTSVREFAAIQNDTRLQSPSDVFPDDATAVPEPGHLMLASAGTLYVLHGRRRLRLFHRAR